MAEWVTAIVALLGGIGGLGGILSIFLFYGENKRSKQLENEHKANSEWSDLVDKHKLREKDLEAAIKDRDATISVKDNKIDSLYKENNELRKRNDKLSSKVAVLSVLRCKVVGCGKRQPPIGVRDTEEQESQSDVGGPAIEEQTNNGDES